MSEDIFRLAEKKDAPEFLELLYSAFQPIRNLEIDWPSARADIDMVTENMKIIQPSCSNGTDGFYQQLRSVFRGRVTRLRQNIRSSGGLRRFLS